MGRERAKAGKLTKRQVDKIKKLIESEMEKLVFKDTYESEEFNIDVEDRSDEVDQANADVSNANLLRFRNREVFYVKKLRGALKRIEENDFGTCVECDEYIRFERLVARPTAELCIRCKEESEREESNNFLGRQSKSLGKMLNLVRHI